jgi:chromosome partitioning protein
MAVRIAIVSQKGGVGKTTICLNLGLALAEKKRNVLLVDLDPQGAIGLSLARRDTEWTGLAELLMNTIDPGSAVIRTKQPHLSILPRGRLDPADACAFERLIGGNGSLPDALSKVEQGSDFVLIDTPSGIGMLTHGALRSAHFVLIPTQAEPLAIRSIGQILRVIESVRKNENPNIELLGIVPTMVDTGNEASKQIFWSLWSGLPAVLNTYIPRSEVFGRATTEGRPVAYLGGRRSPEAGRFAMLADEVDRLVRAQMSMENQDEERQQLSLL